MARSRWRVVVLGVAVLFAGPSAARAGILDLFLSSGPSGSSAPGALQTVPLSNPSGSPSVAVTGVPDGGNVQAGTAGGSSFFGGAGTPVLLNLADGSAYLASPGAPVGALPPPASPRPHLSPAPPSPPARPCWG